MLQLENSLLQTATPDHLSPRKRPLQARAAVKLDAIFEATIQLLVAEGLPRLTTTRVEGTRRHAASESPLALPLLSQGSGSLRRQQPSSAPANAQPGESSPAF